MPRPSDWQTPLARFINRAIVVFAIVAFTIRAVVIVRTRFLYDDAFITFQYAHNLARRNGLVYQAGERVLGTTSPLYAAVLAIFEAARIPSPVAAPWLNLLLDALSLLLLVKWTRRGSALRNWTQAVLVTGFALEMLSPLGMEAGNGGMESALFRFLLVLFWLHLRGQRIFQLLGLSFLLSATRPEGPLYAALMLSLNAVAEGLTKRKVNLMDLLLLVVAVGCGSSLEWALVGISYGSAFPVSVSAKLSYATLLARSAQTAFTASDVPLRFFGSFPGILAGILYIYGLGWIWKKEPALISFAAVPLVYYPALARADVIAHPWYYLPPLAFYYLGVAAGLIRLIDAPTRKSMLVFVVHFALFYPLFEGFAEGALPGLPWVMPAVAFFNSAVLVIVGIALAALLKDTRSWQWLANAGAVFLFGWLLLAFWNGKPIAGMAEYAISYRETNRALAQWVSEKYPGASLAIGEIGYAGYALPIRILDLVGLVHPEVARLRASAAKTHPEEAGLPEVLAHFKPDFVAIETHLINSSPLPKNAYFKEHYRRLQEFASQTGRSLTLFAARK